MKTKTTTADGELSHDDLRQAIQTALDNDPIVVQSSDGDDDGYISKYDRNGWVMDVFGSFFIYCRKGDYYKRTYTVGEGNKVAIGDTAAEVQRQTIYADLSDGDGDDTMTAPGIYEAGRKQSKKSQDALAAIHTHTAGIAAHAQTIHSLVGGLLSDGGTPTSVGGNGFYMPMAAPSILASTREALLAIKESASGLPEGATVLRESGAHLMEASALDDGKLSITIIKPGFNVTGARYYEPEGLKEAATTGFFVGKKMYIDHPTSREEKERPERSFRDIGAVIESTRVNADGHLIGDAKIVDPDLAIKLALFKKQGVLEHVGLSINTAGKVKPGLKEGKQTHIVSGFVPNGVYEPSVDFVTQPGAGGGIALMESVGSPTPATTGGSTVDEETKKLFEALRTELAESKASQARIEQQLKESHEEAANARAIAGVQVKVVNALAAIPDAELPAIAKARVTRMFESATTDERLQEAIDAEKAYVKKIAEEAGKATPTNRRGVHGMGARVTESATDGADVIAPIQESVRDALSDEFGGTTGFDSLMREIGVTALG